MPECPKYVFGYGSLMHPESAFKTISNLSQQQEFIPARLTGYRRAWTAIIHNRLKIETADGKIPTFLAYMNIEKDLGNSALGVIISVSDDDIEALDVREEMYIRSDVTDHIEIINEKKWSLPENAKVFTYISFSPIPRDQFENDTAIRHDYIQLIENASKQIDERLGDLKLFQDDFSRVNKSVKNWPKLDVPEKIDEGRYKVSDI